MLLRRFRRLSVGRRLLIVEAVAWLALARLALVAMPFRHLAARFGALATPSQPAAGSQGALTHDQAHWAREISWAVTRAARYVPFRAVCLPQAIAGKAMLGRRRIASVMHFGVAREPDAPLQAHAWLDAADIQVTGYPVAPGFVEIACFV